MALGEGRSKTMTALEPNPRAVALAAVSTGNDASVANPRSRQQGIGDNACRNDLEPEIHDTLHGSKK